MVLNPTELSNYTISKTDIAAIRKGEEVSENEVEETVSEDETQTIDIPDPEPIEDYNYDNLVKWIKIGGGALCIIILVVGLIIWKRR